MKRIQIFTIRDMPDNLIKLFRRMHDDNLIGHFAEYSPDYQVDPEELEEYEPWQLKYYKEMDKWLKENGLDESNDQYRYVLISYQPL